jgi:hypothetical protein
MSDEEESAQKLVPLEEQLNTETAKPTKLNKNGKPRKPLTPEALERLAKAREKANAIRKQQQVKKLEEKVEKLNTETEPVLGKKELKEKELKEEPQEKELKEEHEEVAKKPRGKKKTKIVVEQSSDDSDEFEPNDNVVFVKRISRKKKEVPAVEPPPIERQPQMEEPPPIQRQPVRRELTSEQRVLKSQYEGMFSGGFMNQSNMMRKHY